MSRTTTWRFLAVLGLGAAGCLGAPIAPGLGVADADAKAFYTRKRVNGTWVEGRFPKASAARSAPSSRAASRGRKGRTVVAAAPAPTLPTAPLPPRPERDLATPEAATPAGAERLSHLHRALQAKAQALAAAPRDERPAAATAPRSVLLDFQTGLKTTQFEGDVVVREPFDVSAMRAIASPPPSPGPAAGWLDGRGRRPRT